MRIIPTDIPNLLIVEPTVFSDARGFFFESFNQRTFQQLTGIDAAFVQDNHSRSSRNVLRGLHYQIQHPQGKLVRVISGEIWDVSVDLRKHSPTFGKSFGLSLSADNKRMIWMPAGFAHGFLVLSESAEVLYKTTDYWMPEHERCILWNDPDLSIPWPLQGEPVLSAKDQAGKPLREAELYP